mgnify:CR=1 FL=1
MTKSATRVAADKATFTQAEVTAKDTAAKAGRKNLILNGGFDVWQRGTSFSGAAEYSSDRWKTQTSGNLGTTTRSTDAPDTSRYATKIAITGSAAFLQFGQQVEFSNFHRVRGKVVTLSFWAKAAGITSLTSRIRQGTTTEDETALFAAAGLSVETKTINTAWQKFTHTFTVGANATAISTDFSTGAVVSGNELYIGQVQLELGSVATDFEHRSYGEELALCQRYYWRQNGDMLGTACNVGVSNADLIMRHPTTMRGTPTGSVIAATAININDGSASFSTAINFYNLSTYSALVRCSTSSATVGGAASLSFANASDWIAFEAEL